MFLDEILSKHAAALRTCQEAWSSAQAGTPSGVSTEEAAAGLLEHAGMLYRYTAEEGPLADLERRPAPERIALVQAACRYLEQVTLAEECEQLLRSDALSNEDLDRLEAAVIERDALEAALLAARRLVRTLPEAQRRSLMPALARASANIQRIDLVLRSRPDVASVVWRAVAPLEEHLRTPVERRPWWFGEARRLDEAFERLEQSALASSRAADVPLGRPSDRFFTVAPSLAPARRETAFSSEARPQEATAAFWGSSARSSRPVQLVAAGLTGIVVECTWLADGRAQFAFKDEAYLITSFQVEGHQVALFDGDREVARTTVQFGVATLPAVSRFTSCEVFTKTGQSLGKLQVRAEEKRR